MTAVKELIRIEENGTLSFGDNTLHAKAKKDNFEFEGDIYKVKTFSEITKLEKNGMFLFESVPGSVVKEMKVSGDTAVLNVYGNSDVQMTFGLEPEGTYQVYVDGDSVGEMTTNISGKLSISAELSKELPTEIKIVRR